MYINLGDVYSKLNNINKAQIYLRKAIKIAENAKNKALLGAAQNTYGITFTHTGELDSALNYFEKSTKNREEIKEFVELYWNYNNIGGIYYYYNDFDKALFYFTKCLETAKKMNSLSAESTVLNNIGAIYKELKQYDKSLEYHQKAYNLAKKIKQANVQLDALENIKITYETKGSYKEAFDYLLQFNQLKDSLFSIEKSKQINEIQTKYNVEKKNEQLKNQRKLIEKAKIIRIALFIIIILVFLGAVAIVLWLRSKQKQHLQQVIFEEKQKGLQQIIETEEKERTRIAKDLHDGIVQDLTVLKMKLNQIGGDQDLIKDFDSSIKQVREISYQMMPVTLRELGLVPALDDMLEKTLKPNGISVDFEAINTDFRFPENIEVSLFRITQELVNNVIKHSNAKHVSVILRYQNDQITLVFEDDGQGFNLEATKKGIGLNSLSSRVELVNGNINYESNEHSGTIAIVRIPYKK
jgi:signal transduction histidine kinase